MAEIVRLVRDHVILSDLVCSDDSFILSGSKKICYWHHSKVTIYLCIYLFFTFYFPVKVSNIDKYKGICIDLFIHLFILE